MARIAKSGGTNPSPSASLRSPLASYGSAGQPALSAQAQVAAPKRRRREGGGMDVASGFRRTVMLLALVVALGSACDEPPGGPSPPQGRNLTGTWLGPLPLRLPDEDWSEARLVLEQSGSAAAGTITSRDGTRRPLTGTVSRETAVLAVGGLPGTSTCAEIQLSITSYSRDAAGVARLNGHASGRCYGTVAGAFELHRAP